MSEMVGVPTVWRIVDIMRRCAASRSTIERLIRDPEFPPAIQITPRLRRWDSAAVEEWLSRRQAAKR